MPPEDRHRFDRWIADLFRYFAELIEHRRIEPGDDTISHLVAAGGDESAGPLLRIIGFASPWSPAATTRRRDSSAVPPSC